MMKNFLFALLIFSWSLITAQNSDCSFGLVMNSTTASIGETITIDVTTRQFNDIAGIQYNHQWNPEQLQFQEIIYNGDSPILSNNFNSSTEETNLGILKFLYLETSSIGVNLPDNTTLYSLRFTKLQDGETQVNINGDALAIEIIETSTNAITNYFFIHSTVTNDDALFPVFNSACIEGEGCTGSASGSINIDTENSESLSFQWQNSNGFEATTEDINSLASSTYSLLATHSNGQHIYGDFYISSASQELSVQLTIDHDECGGAADGAITASVTNGSGDYTYLWSNGETTPSLNNLEGGSYYVTVTDNINGCTGTSEAQVESSATFWISQQTESPTCNTATDGSINLTVDGPATYAPFTFLWSNGSTTEDLDNIEAGFYSVTITANNGCSIEYGVLLPAIETEIPATITHTNCQNSEGGTISLDINTADYSILWSTGQTSAFITDLSSGDYSVTISDNNSSCTYVSTYTIGTGELLVAYSVLCEAANTQIDLIVWDANDTPYTFEWSTGDVTTSNSHTSLSVDANGLYSVTITGASGCSQVFGDMLVDCSDATIDLSLNPEDVDSNYGSSFCLDIKAADFTSQLGFQFSLEWDASLLGFSEVSNLGLPFFSATNFNEQLTDEGMLSVAWSTALAESLPPASTLFSICFNVITEQEISTHVSFSNTPTPIEFVNGNQVAETVTTQNAQIDLNGGGSGNDDPLELIVGNTTTNQNELVCVPVTSNGFSNIIGLQFSLAWDIEGLEYNSIQNINVPDANLDANFSTIEEAQSDGTLRFLWVDNNASGSFIQQGTPLFEVCYIAHGEPGDYPVSFSQTPVPTQAVRSNLEEVTTELTSGNIEILDQLTDEPVILGIASAAIGVGQDICLPVYAIEVEQMLAMQFSINWDQELINFESIELGDELPGLSTVNFFTPAEGGILTFAWYSPDLSLVTLPEDTPLFEICFSSNLQEGVAAVSFSNQPTPFEFIRGEELVPFSPLNGQIVVTSDGIIWPGDTDTNTEVNHFDLLNIGIAFGAEGTPRDNPSINWHAQYADLWDNQTPLSAINFRHMDTDGNGVVNEDDVYALEQNWGQTTEGFTESTGESRELDVIDAPFYIQPDTVQAGTEVYLPIMLGTEDTNVEEAYGIAFSIYYDPQLVRPGSAHVLFDGWLGNQDDGLLGIYRDHHAWGRIDIALVRTNGQTIDGNGQIASFGIIMEDVIFRDFVDAELFVRIENVRLINVSEEVIPTSPRESTILVENLTNNNEVIELHGLQIYPNPTTNSFSILHPDIAIQNVLLFDSKGQLQRNLNFFESKAEISDLATGVYWIQFQTDKGIAYRKLIKL